MQYFLALYFKVNKSYSFSTHENNDFINDYYAGLRKFVIQINTAVDRYIVLAQLTHPTSIDNHIQFAAVTNHRISRTIQVGKIALLGMHVVNEMK